jgi:hypothetical protein
MRIINNGVITMKKLLTTICALLLYAGTLFSQVTANLTIENQQAVGSDFFFDIYLTRTGTNDLYLGTADFVLTFDAGNFNLPILSKEPTTAPGLCTLVPTDLTFPNPLITQINYFNNTSVEILSGNQLVVNLNGPTPTDITALNTTVARIDNTPLTHRLGRFKVSGIQNLSGNMNLQWVVASTLVYTINTSTYDYEEVTFNAINPGNAPLPVELVSFTTAYKNSAVMLNWQTKTEVNNYGFNVERRINEGDWNSIAFIEGHGNSNSPKEYSYIDKDIFAGGSKFQYRLKQLDNDGSFEYSEVAEVEVVPTQYELSQNYPNPFNPSTTIRFSLPKQTQLKINIYNMIGEQVATIAEGMYESGYHKVTFNASNLPSGTYIYRLQSNEFVQVKKMILLK